MVRVILKVSFTSKVTQLVLVSVPCQMALPERAISSCIASKFHPLKINVRDKIPNNYYRDDSIYDTINTKPQQGGELFVY
jgi:hypothetical protein